MVGTLDRIDARKQLLTVFLPFAQSDRPAAVVDADGRIVAANPVLAKQIGDAAGGCLIEDALPPPSAKAMRTGLAALSAQRRPQRIPALSPSIGEFELLPVGEDDDAPLLGALVIGPAPGRRAQAERLREAEDAERLLDALMRHVPEGIVIADAPNALIRRVSDYGVAMSQRPRETLERIPAERHADAWRVFRPDGTLARPDELPLVRAIREGAVVTDVEMQLERRDGVRIPILCNAGPVLDEDGAIIGGIVAWRDITALKRTGERLRERELRHRLALEGAAMAEWDLDLSTGLLARSALIDRLFGVESKAEREPVARFVERIHPEDRARVEAIITEAPGRFELEYRIRRPEGEELWVLVRGEALTGPDGKPARLVGVLMDVTRRKQEEQALSKALAEKQAALDHSRTLFNEVNHRIKNSLQLVASLLNLQARTQDDPTVQAQFAEAHRRVLTVAQVHERLYRTERVAAVEFGSYLAGLCRDLELALTSGGRAVRIDVTVETVELPTDRVVPLALVANELITNAVKYAYPDEGDGVVEVAFSREGDGYRLAVSDRGRGLPPDFDVAKTGSLGMRLVMLLLRQAGGDLTVERLTPGTRFVIAF